METPIIKYRQYVIVPKSPKMSKGKIASQVAHATFMALEDESYNITQKWKNSGMCVIVLECKDTHHLNNIAKYLKQWDILHHEYFDEGLTEVLPMTPTALATGILTEEQAQIFSTMELFK